MSERPASHFEPLSRLWRILALPEVLMGLLGLLGASLLLATLIPQIPPQAIDDPQAWLAVQGGASGLSERLIRILGLFDIYHAGWFRLLLALSGLVLTIRLIESAEVAWRAAAPHRWSAAHFTLWGPRAPHHTFSIPLPGEETSVRLRQALSAQGFRWAAVGDAPTPSAVVGRRTIALWAWPLAYGALLIGLLGLAVGGGWGWSGEDWSAAPGTIRAIGHESNLAVRLDALETTADGRPCDASATLTWLADEQTVATSQVRLGRPATHGGATVRLVGARPVVRVRGLDERGLPLTLQSGGPESHPAGEVELVFAPSQDPRFVLVPGKDLYLALRATPPASDGQITLSLTRLNDGDGTTDMLAYLHRSGTVVVDDVTLQIEMDFWPVLRFDHHSTTWVVLGLLLLAVTALAVAWASTPGLVWLALESTGEGQTTVHLLARPLIRGDRWWAALGERLREALTHGD